MTLRLYIMLMAMLPITELRGSIPFAIGVFKMSAWEAFFWSVIGDVIPMLAIVYTIGPVSNLLMKRYVWCDRFLNWIFQRTRLNFERKYLRYGELALIIFTAVPLPLTGAWSAAVAAFLFGIPPRSAVILITGGVVIAGIVVTLMSMGALGGLWKN